MKLIKEWWEGKLRYELYRRVIGADTHFPICNIRINLYIDDLEIDSALYVSGLISEEQLIANCLQRLREARPAQIEMLENALQVLREVESDGSKVTGN